MGAFATFFVQIVASLVVGKVVTELTDNEAIGAIAGMAAGYGVGTVAGGAGAAAGASETGSSAVQTTVNAPGSSLADPGLNGMEASMMSDGMFSEALSPVATAPAESASNGFMSGLNDFVSGIDTNEWMKLGGGLLDGYNQGKIAEEKFDIDRETNQISRDRLSFEQGQHNSQGAFGVTNDGRVVPINVGQGLQDVNAATARPMTTLNTMSTINTIQRPDGGYMSSFGRFGNRRPDEENA